MARSSPVLVEPVPLMTQVDTAAPLAYCPRISAAEAPLDDTRLAAILRQHFDMVWRALRRFGVTEDAVDDAAQEVFIIAARKLGAVEIGTERQFLYGLAVRVAANARRAQRGRREHADEVTLAEANALAPGSDSLLDEKRLRQLLDNVLNQFPPELRTPFVLFEFEGFSEREIAELCGVPLGTVASRLRRARSAFQEAARRLKARLSRGDLT